MMRLSWGTALALAWLAASPGGSRAAEPQIALRAVLGMSGDMPAIAVTAQTPLPDGAIVVFRAYRSGQPSGELPLVDRRATVKGGGASDYLGSARAPLLPGDYRVTVHVDAIEAQPEALRRSIVPPLRRLKAETVVRVGSRSDTSVSVNRAVRLLLAQVAAIRQIYPEFAWMLDRAWKKSLSRSEWQAWGARQALLRAQQQLRALLMQPGVAAYLPESYTRAQAFIQEIDVVCSSIDEILNGRTERNDNLVRLTNDSHAETASGAVAAAAPKPDYQSETLKDLYRALYREGCGAYASFVRQLFAEVDAAVAAGAVQDTGRWSALVSTWGREIAAQVKLLDELDEMDWAVERGDRKVRIIEAFAKIKDCIETAGSAKDKAERDTVVATRREEIARLLTGLLK